MSFKNLAKNLLLIFMAVGFPLLIFQNIFQSDLPRDGGEDAAALAEIERQLSQNPRKDYQLHSVQDHSGVLRVNILLVPPPSTEEELRMRALSALYDVQSLVGKEKTVGVWAGNAMGQDQLTLLGVAFYSSITKNLSFQTAEEIEATTSRFQ